MDQIFAGRQAAAARALLGLTQDEVGTRAGIAAGELAAIEGGASVSGYAAVRCVLEAAGIVFSSEESGRVGVSFPQADCLANLTRQIDALDACLGDTPVHHEPSPERALGHMKLALVKNSVTKLKNRSIRLGDAP